MQDPTVGVRLFGADGHVVPEQVVVFELLLQSLGETFLAIGHARKASAERRYESGHVVVSNCVPGGMMHRNESAATESLPIGAT